MYQPSRIQLEEAYLLHRRNYRETSLLLDFFTRSHGRITLLGRGVRRQKGIYAALVWPFVPLAISWSGRGSLPLMVNAERIGPANAPDLACALYLNELIVQLLAPGDPHPRIFELYRNTLQQLASSHYPACILRFFELSFLEEIGYALALDRDVESGLSIQADRYYEYRPEHGPVESGPTADAIRGSTLLGLRRRELATASAMREAKCLLRRVISHHLGGRPLRSRELFKHSSPQ